MNRFHSQVCQLITNVVVRLTNRMDFTVSNQNRVSGTEVIFFMNNRFRRIGQGGNAAEGHFAVTAVKGTHQTFATLGITGNDGHFSREIDVFEGR